MTEAVVDLHQGQDIDQGLVQELVQIETESGVTNVENMIILLAIVQMQTQMKRWNNYSNCIVQEK